MEKISRTGRYSPPKGQEPKELYRQPPPRGVGWTLERVTNGCKRVYENRISTLTLGFIQDSLVVRSGCQGT